MSRTSELEGRLAEAEERTADLELKVDARDADIRRLQREIDSLKFLNGCQRTELERLRPPRAREPMAKRASNEELKPTAELLRFLGS